MSTIVTKRNSLVLIVILTLVILAAASTYLVRDKAARNEANQAKDTLFAAGLDTPYVDQNGVPTSLDQYLGKIIVVNSWASWSPFSVQELQDLNILAGEFKNKNVVVIAVNRKENKDQADRFLATLPPLTDIKIVTDTSDYFYQAVGGYAMPETIIYNQAGTIVEHRPGVVSLAELRTFMNELIRSDS